jgi:signal transduction histidine kinase
LLRAGRPPAPRLRPTDPRTCLNEVAVVLRPALDPRVALAVPAAPDLGTVRADPDQLHRVLLNLCLNARDAMPDGGRLRLEAANAMLDEAAAARHAGARPGVYVVFRVADTGTGISAEVLDKVFEPYFTTKGPGKGTGLGLATVRELVKDHAGFMTIETEPGRGTQVSVYLPAEDVPASPALPAPPPRRLPCAEQIRLPYDPGSPIAPRDIATGSAAARQSALP